MDTERMYGLIDDERLEVEAETIVERVIDDAVETPGEPFDATAARIKWPIEVFVFKHMEIPSAESIGEDALERVLENLDEEHADPDGDSTDATDAMKAAALTFGKAVVADYKSWACERTGEVITFSREKALELFPEPAAPASCPQCGRISDLATHEICAECQAAYDAAGKPSAQGKCSDAGKAGR